ncbi:MAG: hypothetical protein OEM99_13875 [Gammaproteobacteria bacterium]|nr:hypothetical protein [Gammaproteobacteria bacterium]
MTFRNLLHATALVATGVLFATPASAQPYEESEPNNPCVSAQFIGMPSGWPAVITGDLILTGSEPPSDIDFFMLQGTEGMRLRAGLRGATDQPLPLGDPFLGLFDMDCNLLAWNDDFLGLNSRLDFEVPTGGDGYFILAASGCCDIAFDGNHFQEGTYRLRVSIPPTPIQAITGRLVDAVTGAPLPGNTPPYPYVELLRCTVDGCFAWINNAAPDEFGIFRFETDNSGLPLDPGQFIVRAYAQEYSPTEVVPFDVASGDIADLGDIALQPPQFVFENIVPCTDIPATGGKCIYSIDIRSNIDVGVKGLGWSIINAWGSTSPVGFTQFPADHNRIVALGAFKVRTLSFSFNVPRDVGAGTFMCADAWFSDRTTDHFGTLRYQQLFCVMKQYDAFTIVDAKTAAGMLGRKDLGASKGKRQ